MNKKQFWENKIQGWEKKRYGKSEKDSSLIASLNSFFGSSLTFRFKKAAEILSPHLNGKHLLDIGCGSEIFLEALPETNLSHYTGIDWASGAIESAKQLPLQAGWSGRTTFFCR